MKDIIELNHRIIGHSERISDDGLLLGRNGQPVELQDLPAKLQTEINVFRGKLNEVIPNDFEYTLCLGDDSPYLGLEFKDGAHTGFFRGHEWRLDTSIIEQLKQFDWDGERQQGMTGCQVFDELVANTKHLPGQLPSTKELQKAFSNEMKPFLKAKRKDDGMVYVLMWRDDEGIRQEPFENMESFCRQLPDIMTVQYLVITVVAEGKPLARAKIEKLKKQALKELEDMPISHAKALGKL
jgi:hypothetical protein